MNVNVHFVTGSIACNVKKEIFRIEAPRKDSALCMYCTVQRISCYGYSPTDPVPNTPDTTGIDSPRTSRFGGSHRSSLRSHGSIDGDFDPASMVPRHHSEVEGLGGGNPLRELLNYCTGISFEGFLCAESELCVYTVTHNALSYCTLSRIMPCPTVHCHV